MYMRLLIIAGIILGIPSFAFAGEINPPKPVTYQCPELPTTFKVGGSLKAANGMVTPWIIDSVADVAKGSTITMDSSDTYKYTGNPVYASIFGKTLHCDGILTLNGKQYAIVVSTQISETNCKSNPDGMSFECLP